MNFWYILNISQSDCQSVKQSVSPSIRPSFHQFDSHFIIFIDINDKIWNMRDDFYQQFVRPSVHFIGSRTSSTEKLMVPRKKTVCKKCCCLLSVTTTTWISRISQYNWNQNVLLPCAKKKAMEHLSLSFIYELYKVINTISSDYQRSNWILWSMCKNCRYMLIDFSRKIVKDWFKTCENCVPYRIYYNSPNTNQLLP